MNPMRTEAGPPVWKALPDPINKPAPIAPPLRASVSLLTYEIMRFFLHSNHLHVPASEFAMERILASGDAGPLLHGALWRCIVQLFLAERGISGLLFHACSNGEGLGSCEGESCGGGDDGRPSLFMCYLACHASMISVNGRPQAR